ncbi:PREDICTED: putative ATP-dependent RNA helicase DHX33 [Amphimedon queenslandica]|uniref:RNA helicase n=1 Tax=Amphimedon queenslandica TaxID=400682 RepID=A0A1X7UWT2_AMPQE|nr:PREDICTED: putative ATP-dependent RNA helicase DHX33 [Amphimedon queenslandica]|eukprot:XP_019852052.1 PREDICTED: putative ATP-dependent RNA helicase DHX33 [Amphimedon queenslandica]
MASSMEAQRKSLPIYSARDRLIREIKTNPCCIVVGETGSGKTTQIPQYLHETGLSKKGLIGITQPRRVAAISIATRVAKEQSVSLGAEVGYAVRFEDCTGPSTKIKYQTDGLLLREAIQDPLLSRYSVVILDEAHERTVHTDVLFGVIKGAQKERRERHIKLLRIVIMSATLDTSSYSNYFNNAKVLYIQGRQYHVNVYYTLKPQSDYIHSAITTVLQLHGEEESGENGDILVFLTGQDEIESMLHTLIQCKSLFPSHWKDMMVLPLFSALPSAQQQKVFQKPPPNTRKVILSTNIAETSLTLSGVKYVIDTGMVKGRGYNPLMGLDLLLVQPISKAQARQRLGRAGRESEGYCYRLYTEESFLQLEENTVPEIQRCNLSSVLLQLLAMGIKDILSFEFMDQPPEESLIAALEELVLLKAVNKEENGEETLELTPLGQRMSSFPLSPSLSSCLLASVDYDCVVELVTLVSLLSVDTVLYTPTDGREKADLARMKFFCPEGDHLLLMKIHKAYQTSNEKKSWCHDNYIHARNMSTVQDIRKQLKEICRQNSLQLTSNNDGERLRKTLLCGFFRNVAEHVRDGKYLTVLSRQEVFIHPSSCLFSVTPPPPFVMYTELVHTTKCYMRMVSVIDPKWLFEIAPNYFHKTMTTNMIQD